MVRNIMEAVLYMHDHTVHFYQLHALDWVDIVSGLKADPKAAALLAQQLSPWPKNTEGYFTEMQNKLKKFVASGQLGIFANGYWGHPAYKLTPEQNLIATIHYLEALEWQKEIVKVHAVFGGKNPHPNFLVGGMPVQHRPERGERHQCRTSRTGETEVARKARISSTRCISPTS